MAERTDPYRNYRFRVEIASIQVAAFASATIPDESSDQIEYREGTDPFTRKLSGYPKVGSLTLKRGITTSMELYEWWQIIRQTGTGVPNARRNISIILVDDAGNDAARWDLVGAWPSKYQAGDLDGKGNDVLIETFEVAVETIKRTQ
ncbi:phage tail protein [Sorangium sp. So ce124]|uniref:phage tail protein n=1 Tax=Sorangium sp. So ce124 TaxID=3133280 RepID=UPI003F5FD965